jgi:hypothetical protein
MLQDTATVVQCKQHVSGHLHGVLQMSFDLNVSLLPTVCCSMAGNQDLVLDLIGEPDSQRPAKSLCEVQADARLGQEGSLLLGVAAADAKGNAELMLRCSHGTCTTLFSSSNQHCTGTHYANRCKGVKEEQAAANDQLAHAKEQLMQMSGGSKAAFEAEFDGVKSDV